MNLIIKCVVFFIDSCSVAFQQAQRARETVTNIARTPLYSSRRSGVISRGHFIQQHSLVLLTIASVTLLALPYQGSAATLTGMGKALSFNGTNQYVSFSDTAVPNASASVTVECWVRMTDTGSGQGIVDRGRNLNSGNGGNWWLLRSDPADGWARGVVFGGHGIGELKYGWSDTEWHHVAGVYDGVTHTLRLYVDGIERGSRTDWNAQLDVGSAPLRIGGRATTPGVADHFFSGTIDDVRIWSTARTQSDVQTAMSLPLRGDEANLLGYWNFNEGSGSSAYDYSTGNAAGTLVNAPAWVDAAIPVRTSVYEVSTLLVQLGGSDSANDGTQQAGTIRVKVTGLPAHGVLYEFGGGLGKDPVVVNTLVGATVTGDGNRVIYRANAGYIGPDSFTYRIVSVAANGTETPAATDGTVNIDVKALPPGYITTVAGNGCVGFTGDGSNATGACLNNPNGVAIGPTGTLYISDQQNNRIRTVDTAGNINTLIKPPSASSDPWYVSMFGAAANKVFTHTFTNNSRFDSESDFYEKGGLGQYKANDAYAINPSDVSVAMTGASVLSASAMRGWKDILGWFGVDFSTPPDWIDWPRGITVGPDGDLYYASMYSYSIFKKHNNDDPAYVAGTGASMLDSIAYHPDATGFSFSLPEDVAVDSAGNKYVVDTAANKVYKVTPDGKMHLFCGAGWEEAAAGYVWSEGSNATWVNLSWPTAVAVDPATQYVYIADAGHNRILVVHTDVSWTPAYTVAGDGTAGFGGDRGPARNAQLNFPTGLNFDRSGNLYVAEMGNERIRMIGTNGTILTIAGNGVPTYNGDGMPAAEAGLNYVEAVAADADGNLYIADRGNHRVRKVKTFGTLGINATAEFTNRTAVVLAMHNPFPGIGTCSKMRFSNDNGTWSDWERFDTMKSWTLPGGDGVKTVYAQFMDTNGTVLDASDTITLDTTPPAPTFAINFAAKATTTTDVTLTVTGTDASGISQMIFTNEVDQYGKIRWDANHAELQPFAATTQWNLLNDLSAATSGAESVAPGVKTVYARFADNAGNGSAVLSAQIVWDPNPPVVTVVANNGFPYTGEQTAHLTMGITSVSGAATMAFSTDNTNWSAPEPFATTKTLSFTAVNGWNTIYVRVTSNAGLVGQATTRLFYNPTISAATIATTGGNGNPGSVVLDGGDRVAIGSFSGDGGSAALAAMNGPTSVSADPFGSVYVTDWGNRRIRKIDSLGMITTYAGTGDPGWSGDGGLSPLARIGGDWGVHATTGSDLLLSGHPYGDYLGELFLVKGDCPISYYMPSLGARPGGTATDASGNLYFADTNNHRIRRIDKTTGVITTVAGNGTRGFSGDNGPATAGQLNEPTGVAVDSAGILYIADASNHRIRKVENNVITTIAGTGTAGFSGDNGPAVSALLNLPADVAVDGSGNLFISDTNNRRVRKIDAAGIITTAAGTGTAGYTGDLGAATAAQMGRPQGLSLDGAGSLFIADTDNNVIRKIEAATGIIWTVAGTGSYGSGADGATARTTALASPTGVAVDSAGALFITEAASNHIRTVSGFIAINGGAPHTVTPEITLNLACPHLEGCSNMQLSGDGTAWLATESYAAKRAWTITGGDGFRRVYVRFQNGTTGSWSDVYNDGILLDTTAPAITQPNLLATVAGNNLKQVVVGGGYDPQTGAPETMGTYSGDNGLAPAAGINRPEAIAFDGSGNLYIADSRNYRVRKVTPAGVITTVAGNGSQAFDVSMNNGQATAAAIGYPSGVALSGTNLYISDSYNHRIYRVDAGGVITSLAGTGAAGFSGDGGSAGTAQLHGPQRMTFDGSGNLFFVDSLNFRVRKITPGGTISTVAGNGTFGTTGTGGPALSAPLSNPHDVAVAADGTLYIAEEYHRSYQDDIYYQIDVYGQCNQRSTTKETDDGMVRKVTPEGTILAFAGGPGNSLSYSGDGGPAVAAELSKVSGVEMDASGNVYIADLGNRRVRKVTASTGIITTVAGNGSSGYAGDGYAGLTTSVDSPYDVALSPSGALYIADRDNQLVRKLVAGYTVTPALTNSTAIVFNVGSNEAGTTYECALDAGGFTPCGSTATYPNLSDGTHRLTVRPTDAVGNVGAPVTYTWAVDTMVPLAILTQTPSSYSNNVNPAFAFMANKNVSGFSCKLDTGVEAACTTPFTLTGLSEGVHTFSVRATDTAGNRPDTPTSFTWTVDTTPPVVTFSDHPAAVTRSTDAAFSFSASETVAGYQCSLDGAVFADCTSPVSITGLAAQSHAFQVKARDLAGNTGTATHSWQIDRTASALIINPVPSPTIIVNPVMSGTVDKQGCTVTVTSPTPGCNGQAVVSATNWTFNQCVLSAGTNTITVTAVDPAGNVTTGTIPVEYVARNLDYVLKNVFTAGFDMAVDKDGSLYYHDYYMDGTTTVHTISKRDVFTGLISRVAGGNGAAAANGVAALQARFAWPKGLAVDGDYNLYISDGTSVYKVYAGQAGTVSVVASGLSDPGKLALDTQGNLYIADRVYNGVIRKIDAATGTLTVVAGGGGTEDTMDYSTWVETDYSGPATGFYLNGLQGIAVDAAGGVYFNHTYQEWVHSQFIPRTRKVDAVTGLVYTVAGFSSGQANSGDNGPALQAKLGTPRDAVVDTSGNVYIADDGFMAVRVVEPVSATRSSAMIYHYAGTVNGAAPPASAPLANLQQPRSMTADPAGRIYISSSDGNHNFIFKIDGMIEINHGAGATKSTDVNLALLPPFNAGAAHMKVSNLPDLSDATAEDYSIGKAWTVPSGDGVKRVYVQFQNAAGEWSGVYHASILLDTATTVSIDPVGPTRLMSQNLTGTCEAGATVTITTGSGASGAAAVTGTTWQFTVTGLQEGNNPVTVTATDLAGNIATAQTVLVLDTTPPVTHIVAQPPASSSLTTATFQVVCSELNCSYEYKLDNGAYSAPTTTTTATYGNLAGEGTHSFTVRTTDAAGNTATPVSYSWNLDLTPPHTSITATPAAMTCLATSAGFSFTSTEQGSSFLCKLDQPDYKDQNNVTWSGKGSFVPCSSPKSYSSLNLDGLYTFTVKAVDSAGNADATPAVYAWGIAQSSPSITHQPTDRTAPVGGTALFSAAAGGAVSVQWQVSSDSGAHFSDLPGATSTTLSFTAAAADNNKLYQAVFSNGCGTASSSAARLVIDGTAPAGKTWWTVPKTGQTACYDTAGTTISCTGTGQDGELQRGADWPSPRFVAASSGTGTAVTDNLTGLMWPQDWSTPTVGSCTGGIMSWPAALAYVTCLNSANYLGHNDWRLPNIVELESLINTGQSYPYGWLSTQGFANIDSSKPYWSSSASTLDPATYSRYVDFSLGKVLFWYKNNGSSSNYKVQCVRGGQSGTFGDSVVSLIKTGQTTSYAAGDDGDLQKGVSWPSPRFLDRGDQTLLDNATGLIWQQDGSTPATADCTAGQKTWQGALDYVACLNRNHYLGHNDWRLPNVRELASLLNNGASDQTTWLNSQRFTNTMQARYWSSSTAQSFASFAWSVHFGTSSDGSIDIDYGSKGYSFSVRAVRSGEAGVFGATGIAINSGAGVTSSTTVTLSLFATDADSVTGMMISNDGTFTGAVEEAYTTSKSWALAAGADGMRTVYAKFKDAVGNWSAPYADSINLDTAAPVTTASPGSGTYASAQTISLVCNDGTGGGCAKTYYTIDGSTPTTASPVYSGDLSVTSDSTVTLKFFSVDVVGNQEPVSTRTYTISTTGPTGMPWWAYGRTGQTTSYAAGDDGSVQVGAVWPATRFTNNGDQTVTDMITGLIWQRDGSTPAAGSCAGGLKSWQGALDYVACLNGSNYLGHNDWRVPNKLELESLVNAGQADQATWLNSHGFVNTQSYGNSGNYWSSSTLAENTAYAWFVSFSGGWVSDYPDKTSLFNVRSVRGGGGPLGSSIVSLVKTGQTTSYATGDDGGLQKGLPWPAPRFKNNGDQTLTDNLTGLTWQQDGSTPTAGSCIGGEKTWQGALDYAACLNGINYLGHSDWRVPNRFELESITNAGVSNSAGAWWNSQGFTNSPQWGVDYWSSSTYAGDAGYAWIVFYNGYTTNYNKTYSYYVRCVRGGQNGVFGSSGIAINQGAALTTSQTVTLSLSASDGNGVSSMMISNASDFSGASEEAYASAKTWTLGSGDGAKTVYVRFKDNAGTWSNDYSAAIILDATAPATEASPPGGTFYISQSITLTCSDLGSGCAKTYYTLDGSEPTTSSSVYAVPLVISTNATLKFFSTDITGHAEAVNTRSYTKLKAAQAVTVTTHASASAAYGGSFTVSATSASGLGVAITTTGSCSGSGTGSATVLITGSTGTCAVHYNQAGDGNYSAAAEVIENTTAQKADATTAVALTSGANPSALGQALTFTATVTNGATGTVSFTEGAAVYCSSTALVGGQASCSVSSLSFGPHTITAAFSGDGNYNTSSGTIAQTVKKNSTTQLTSVSSTSTYGQNVLLTATVTGGATGTVAFTEGTTTYCTIPLASGQAVCTLSTLGAGPHTIAASYGGDADYVASAATLPHTVDKANTSTAILSQSSASTSSVESFTVNYSVTMTPPASGTPTGTVTVSDGTDSCTGTLPGTSCTLTLATPGTRTLTAVYNGDATANTSTSGGLSHTVNATILRVAAGGVTTGMCEDWAHACDLQYALGSAPTGLELWVKEGTYTPGTDRGATFQLKNGVALYGGFGGTETTRAQRDSSAHVTILSGDLQGDDNSTISYDEPTRSDNSYHVVTASGTDNTAVLDGFTVTGGNADSWPNFGGGGLYSEGGSPTLSNMIFSRNTASYGGAIYASADGVTGSPALAHVTFSENAAEYGGAMYSYAGNGGANNPAFTDVTFSGNRAVNNGGAIYVDAWDATSSPTFTNATFSGNSADDSGGAMYTFVYNGTLSPALTNVTFSGNRAAYYGGAVYGYAESTTSNPTFTNVTFSGNAAGDSGGSMYSYAYNGTNSQAFTNVTFSDNSAVNYGGAMCSYGDYGGTLNPAFTNVTISGNTSGDGGGIYNYNANPVLTNSIVWGNSNGQVHDDGSSSSAITYSVIQDGCPAGSACNNLVAADPLLGPLGNYGGFTRTLPLLAGSPAIDAGSDALCPSTDQRGVARPQGVRCDMGAYEFAMLGTATTLSSSANPSTFGTLVTFTATVSGNGPGGTPAGTVSFTDVGVDLGSATLNSSGQATVSLSALSRGTHSITAAYNGNASFFSSTSVPLTQTVNEAPAITSANSAAFTTGAAGSFTVIATGYPAPVLSESGTLPAGITFNAATGVLSGTPAAGIGGVYQLTFTAHNGTGQDAVQSFTLTVTSVPAITSPASATFTIGTPGTFTVTASGYPAPVLSEAGALPAGITFNATTGVLSGTPAAGTSGVHHLTFTAHNGTGQDAAQNFTLTVTSAPAITSTASATFTIGTPGTFTVTASGYPAPVLSESGALPAGITFNAGVLSGTPAVGTGGVHHITFTAHNGVGQDTVQNFTLTVAFDPSKPALSVSTLPDGAVVTATVHNISGTVSSVNGIQSLTINGAQAPIAADGSFSFPLQLVLGANTMTIVATDNSGQQTTLTRTITMENSALSLNVSTPADNAATSQSFTIVTGKATDSDKYAVVTVTYSVNGAPAQSASITDGAYSFTANLASGMNTIVISATSSTGKTAQAKRTIFSQTPFSLSVNDPSGDIRIILGSYLLKGLVADNATPVTVSIAMDGQTYTPTVGSDGRFQQLLPFSSNTINRVSITGTDQNNNDVTIQRNFITAAESSNPFTIVDALLALKMSVGIAVPDPSQLLKYDVAPLVNGVSVGDGKIDIEDAIVILRKSVGLL